MKIRLGAPTALKETGQSRCSLIEDQGNGYRPDLKGFALLRKHSLSITSSLSFASPGVMSNS